MTWKELLDVLETLKGDAVLEEPIRFFQGDYYCRGELQRSMQTGSMVIIPVKDDDDVE